MKNKKGQWQIIFSTPVLIAVAVIVGLFIFGGSVFNLASTFYNITNFLKSIPAIVWVIIGILFLFLMIGGKKRR